MYVCMYVIPGVSVPNGDGCLGSKLNTLFSSDNQPDKAELPSS